MTTLPLIQLQGPPIPRPEDLAPDKPWDFPPFWELTAVAPEFGADNVKPKKEAVPEDRVRPIRTLLLDPDETELAGRRLPRLVSMHIIGGDSVAYDRHKEEKLVIRLTPDVKIDERPAVIRKQQGKEIRFPFYATGRQRLGFQHVVAEPILDQSSDWPKKIDVPPFRLVTGDVVIFASTRQFRQLGPLRLETETSIGDDKAMLFRLRPDGIELKAKVSFPGTGEIEGRFLLTPDAKGPRLTLLSDRLENVDTWREAWTAVTPFDDDDSEALAGLKVDARRATTIPPAFGWRTVIKGKNVDALAPQVEVPPDALSVRLLSPAGPNGVDGEVTLKPSAYKLAPFSASHAPQAVTEAVKGWAAPQVLLAAEMLPPTATKTTTRLALDMEAAQAKVSLAVTEKNAPGHVCAHDEVALADALRGVYGIDDPPPLAPDGKRPLDRPLLAAFVPLDDGWLQLPVPNFPPPNLDEDAAAAPVPAPPNVLSGYLRYAQAGQVPPVLSAFDADPLTITEAPWVITVEGTQRLALAIGIDIVTETRVVTVGNVPTTFTARCGKLRRAAAALDGPELSTRGLVWISADRPDALEALPRLGAGPGAYLDLPLETLDVEHDPALQFAITKLELLATRHSLSRTSLELALAFNETPRWKRLADAGRVALEKAREVVGGRLLPLSPVVWRRHPRMPLAAAMPMTRGASSAVRPLESRDLVPFAVDVPKDDRLRMSWRNDAVFPALTPLLLAPVAAWPWPRNGEEEVLPQGIALAAFGVPGAEVALDSGAAAVAEPFDDIRAALRYDLPALDEAFATATLPPQPPENALPEERETPPAVPVPLAYDWPVMKRFWEEQNRGHQLARVAHSYLSPYRDPDEKTETVRQLIAGLTWETKLGFLPAPEDADLPYGQAILGGAPVSHNDALRGISGRFVRSGKALTKIRDDAADAGAFDVVGNAPPSIVDDDGFLLDSRGMGMKPLPADVAAVMLRPIRVTVPGGTHRSAKVDALATLSESVAVGSLFRFWFKDLPVAGGELVAPPDDHTDFSAWQDGALPLSGFEWRLVPAADAQAGFERGRDRIPFFGFELEPLRLRACRIDDDRVQSASIICRLHLGHPRSGAAVDANLVTLDLGVQGEALEVTRFEGKDLRFVLDGTSGAETRVVVRASCAWDVANGQPRFTDTSLAVAMFGTDYDFDGATLDPAPAAVTIAWSPKAPVKTLKPGQGMLAVDGVTVTVTPGVVHVGLARRILFVPRAEPKLSDEAVAPPVAVILTNQHVAGIALVHIESTPASASFVERDGAFTLIATSPARMVEVLPGFPIEGVLRFALMARTGAIADGAVALMAGYLDAELVPSSDDAADQRIALRRVTFHADCALRPEKGGEWRGAIRFHGRLSIANAIGWPSVDAPATDDILIPFPDPKASAIDGRTRVAIGTTPLCTHAVAYILDGHALPFDLAARIVRDAALTGAAAAKARAVWSVPVVATHTLTLSQGNVPPFTFTAVETIGIGAAFAIVPHPDAADALAFVPHDAGSGRLGTVLSGALGLPFRRAFLASQPKGLFIAGGFAGLLADDDGASAPLLRLPLLAAVDRDEPLAKGGFIEQRGAAAATVEVAWADGFAARRMVATLRSAVTPASASDAALRTALIAGSRPAAAATLSPAATVAAVLVEQSFVAGWDTAFPSPNLTTQPFFLASAVSLARTLGTVQGKPAPIVLSLVAGRGVVEAKSRSIAAAVVTRNLPLDAAKENVQRRLRSELATLGEDVVVGAWGGPAVSDIPGVVPVALVAGPAFADHVQPLAAILRTVDGNGALHYDAPPLPRSRERARRTDAAASAFADSGRGYGLLSESDPLRWLPGPREGATRPFRDDGKPNEATGLAGLSRAMAMPAHAVKEGRNIERQLVWVAQTRAPIYLPLPLAGVTTPPVPWLSPGSPRPRLPTDDVVAAAVAGTQPILPEAATVASVSDRAGISTARIVRFETSLGEVAAFDERHGRFGRPAQGGSWSLRTERTPRPGPLPENVGNAESDRRPCASPLLPREPLLALIGPADTVRGEARERTGRWTVTFVAAPEWEGMVTEKWDGTIRLVAEVDVELRKDDPPLPGDAALSLLGFLFPSPFAARASLVIGGTVVPFHRLHVLRATMFDPLEAGLHRAAVELVLDARPADSSQQRGPALGAIADALAVVPLPPVEIRLLVHPDTRPAAKLRPDRDIVPLTGAPTDTLLAEGDSRAPVTLRLPLAPIVRSRGALPLVPTSILFVDPSYDAGLSSAPAEHRARVDAPGAVLPEARGALTVSLSADRGRVNRKASITFMVDVAYEKKLEAAALAKLDPEIVNGDLVGKAIGAFRLSLAVVPKNGARRNLFVGTPSPVPIAGFQAPEQPAVLVARVYELQLSRVIEANGMAAAFVAGDVLELIVQEAKEGVTVTLIGDAANPTATFPVAKLHAESVSRTLRIILTDEPVVEPPPALYAALVRREGEDVRLSLPLYAQSPLPFRVDLRDAKADFRRGLMRRSATFIWSLARPRAERESTGIYVVKVDRNGQMFLPDDPGIFLEARPVM